MTEPFAVDDVLAEVEIGPVAHGGHFVARVDGRVIFVRHALSGEVVDVRITEAGKRFSRGEVVAVHRASPERVSPPCAIAGRCGGCDFQHVRPEHTRELKRQVVAELLGHLAGYQFIGDVVEVPPAPFGWRRRMRYHLDAVGRPGLLAHRSDAVVPLPEAGCRIAAPPIAHPPADPGRPGTELLAVAAASGVRFCGVERSAETVTEQVDGRSYEVALTGFWQAHAAAPAVLTERVLDGLQPRAGETALDLYCGVGLFARALADAGAQVWGIEGDRRAIELARTNVPSARFLVGDVARRLERLPNRADIVVLDPPRAGAGRAVLASVVARRPRRIAYVACDPAALGRDLQIAADLGYRTMSVDAYDLFPMTHHVECVAILVPAST
ncbi:MAG TPA: TRAM domain-containing protein [Propionicimonas sp.]|nr:TRAM domain-containing protein [Propionicimonas sp.]HQA76904.1 TRAM domain-containing protein [Propionicimonas sp.]HQD97364.1 TRAM domain-containing protein [Propionicimonas sp.]